MPELNVHSSQQTPVSRDSSTPDVTMVASLKMLLCAVLKRLTETQLACDE